MKNGKLLKLLNTPLRVVIFLGLVAAMANLLTSAAAHSLRILMNMTEALEYLVNTVLLTLALAPALYFLVFRKLLESEERFRQTLATAPNAIVIVDGETRITDWNPAAQRIFGYTREEALGQQMHLLIAPPRYHADAVRGFARFQETGEGPIIGKITEIAALRKDGSEFPAELSISAVKLKSHWHAIGIIHDITERKRAEKILGETQEKIQKIFESSPGAISLLDMNGIIIECNQTAVNMLGYSTKEKLLGASAFNFVVESERQRAMELLQELPARQTIHGVEFTMLQRDGSQFATETAGSVWRDPSGKPTGLVIITTDITERKQAEQALHESEKLYRSLFENMLNGFAYCRMIFEQDQPQDFIYLSVNAAFETLTGLKNVAGKRVSEVIPGIRQSDPGLFEIYGRVSLSGKPEQFEIYLEALQQWFWISVYSPGKGCFVAVFDVITERKRTEAQLTEQLEELRGWHDITLGREMRVIELKHEVNELLSQAGQPPRYPSAESDDSQEK